MEITRELLEQYLTVCKASEEARAAIARELARSATPAKAVARVFDPEELFFLGLCAAAELQEAALSMPRAKSAREEAARRETGRVRRAGDDRGYWAGRIDEGEARRDDLLLAAGIDPEAWERARQKGGA